MSAGIDYGRGVTNIDIGTGIRFGVISQHSLSADALDNLDSVWPDASCPLCGTAVVEGTGTPWQCPKKECNGSFDHNQVFSEEPIGLYYDRAGYQITNCLDSDLMVVCSPYYTLAAFCSPCVPGAGNLDQPCTDGVRTYCLGPEWFEDDKAPYPVWRVSNNQKIA